MRNILKNRVVTIVVLIATLILAGIAVFTAVRLYQLRNEAVAPNAPSSEPAAFNPPVTPDPVSSTCSQLTFSLSTPPPPGVCTYTADPTSLSLKVGESKGFQLYSSGEDGEPTATSTNTTIATVTTSEPFCAPGAAKCPTNAYKVKGVKVGSTTIKVNSSLKRSDGTTPLCSVTVNITISTTVTPTPTPPTPTPAGCAPNATCTPTPTPTPTTTATATSTATSTATATASPTTAGGTGAPGTQTTLPPTGSSFATIIGAGLGILVILGAVLLLI